MRAKLAPESRDKIATLVDHKRDGRFVIAFCPVCDWTAEATNKGLGAEEAASACIAEVKLHIRRAHPSKSKNKGIGS
ncbi:MAG: hypothetical protein WCK57_09035 [Verrucomicrobiae bacterium]